MLDTNDCGLLTFRDVACFYGSILKGDPSEKLAVFYRYVSYNLW